LVTAAGHNQVDLYGDKDRDAEELETGQPCPARLRGRWCFREGSPGVGGGVCS
jgi:hypothetical protein